MSKVSYKEEMATLKVEIDEINNRLQAEHDTKCDCNIATDIQTGEKRRVRLFG